MILVFLIAALPLSQLLPGGNAAAPAALRQLYQQTPDRWPALGCDPQIECAELAKLDIRPPPTGTEDEKYRLGKDLFENPALSLSGQIACQSCHNPNLGWGDGLPRSHGDHRVLTRRNSPPLFNASERKTLFWDGRATSLEQQLWEPLLNPHEMGNRSPAELVQRLAADQRLVQRFDRAYAPPSLTPETIADSLASYLRHLERQTAFDRFIEGDPAALSDMQVLGLHLFRTKAGCANCHHGALLSDDAFHNLGLSAFLQEGEDLGRYEVTGDPADAGAFRTPSLRHVSQTAPYMHSGAFSNLAGVINFYNRGGGEIRARNEQEAGHPLFPFASRTSALLKPLGLTPNEKAALLAFLQAL